MVLYESLRSQCSDAERYSPESGTQSLPPVCVTFPQAIDSVSVAAGSWEDRRECLSHELQIPDSGLDDCCEAFSSTLSFSESLVPEVGEESTMFSNWSPEFSCFLIYRLELRWITYLHVVMMITITRWGYLHVIVSRWLLLLLRRKWQHRHFLNHAASRLHARRYVSSVLSHWYHPLCHIRVHTGT